MKHASTKPVYLAVVGIVRNEAPYIGDWLEFHRLVGVERFYLYDNQSSDATLDVIRWHDNGDIVLTPNWTGDERYACPTARFGRTPQVTAYNHFVQTQSGKVQWAAFTDVDEYLYHAEENDLKKALQREIDPLPDVAALFVSWVIFGSNGHKKKPPGSTIENYLQRGEIGRPRPYGAHGKVIARPGWIRCWGPFGPHNIEPEDGHVIDENGLHVKAGLNLRPTAKRWRLNHYYHRSQEEAAARIAAIDNNALPGFYKSKERLRQHDLNEITDCDILRCLQRREVQVKASRTAAEYKQKAVIAAAKRRRKALSWGI